jgi:hypothetical protein
MVSSSFNTSDQEVFSMFCTSCGSPHANEAASYCYSCGKRLLALPARVISSPPGTGTVATTFPMPPPTTMSNAPEGKKKNPAIAALLNLFFGVGYLYLGIRKVVGIPTTVFVLIAMAVYVVLGGFTDGFGDLLFAILFAIDGWQKGTTGNRLY